jgi:hypothetical protein
VRRTAVVLCLALSTAPAAEAQDIFYRSWRWVKETSAARAAGLGGAITAVPDDASAVESNPAALTTLTKSELVGNLLNQGAGETSSGDALRPRTGLGFVGLGGRLSSRWAVGAYVVEPQAVRLESSRTAQPLGVTDVGEVEGTLTEAGASAAWRPVSGLHVGVRLSASRLDLSGSYRLQPSGGAPLLEVATEGGATGLTTGIGVLYEASPRVWLGLARLGGARFSVSRTARLDGVREQALDAGGPSEVRQPSVVSAGLALLAGTRLLLTGQLDYVRYGEIETPFVSQDPGGVSSRFDVYAWEPRLGLEVSLPFSSFSLQLRAGLAGRSSASLGAGRESSLAAAPTAMPAPVPSPSPTGPTPTRTALQQLTAVLPETPTDKETGLLRGTLGASVATSKGVRLDLAVRLGGEGTAVLAGTAIRF